MRPIDFAQRAFGRDFHGALRDRRPGTDTAGVLDLPENGAVGFDDVFVARQHLPVTPRVAVARRACVRSPSWIWLICVTFGSNTVSIG